GFFTRLTASLGQSVVPDTTMANPYLGPYAQGKPLAAWITWEVLGIVLGGGLGSLMSGRFRLGIEKSQETASSRRIAFALLGGALVGIGSRFARGCTSGLGLSGGATPPSSF
ncbi:MAG: YeeE/YedE family protein, partial [Candidatus Tectomicrobia bacterium]|nr:YeeE/YedE family protein [Candidatus Tectomicrobia bacterium]